MKKCVKKIPKYGNGIPGATAPSPQEQFKSMNARIGGPTSTNDNGNVAGSIAGAVGAASGAVANAFGIEQGKNAAIFNAVGDVAQIIPGVGQFLGPALKTVGAFAGEGGGVDQNTGEVTKSSGLTRVFGWGRDDKAMAQESNRIVMANASKSLTENLRTDYYNNTPGAGSINVLAAEGGIMRQPVDALVSKGELIYNPVTRKLSQVPGSKGKPNKADDVYAKLYEGDVVISNSPTMLMANGKTPAQNLMGMVDKYATGGTVKAREAIIKKVVNWQEANKTKPQEYAMYKDGTKGVNKYGYNKNLLEFAYWDKEKNDYTDEYKNWVKNLTEQDVRDIEAGKYGDMSTYFGKNPGKKLDIATAQQLMTDKKYGDWHKIGKAVVDKKIANKKPEPFSPQPIKMKIEGTTMYQDVHPGNYPIDYEVSPINVNLKKVPDPTLAEVSKRIRQKERKQKFNDASDNLTGLAPLATAMTGNYDYHVEQPQISPASRVPLNADPRPLFRSADETYSIGNYNFANLGHSTGAGWAYGSKLAADRAKQYADALKWQQETNNNIIAHNVAIENDWGKRYDLAREKAIENTRANEAAADAQRDTRIKDAMGYYRDWQLTPFLKQYLSSGAYDKSIKRLG